MTEDELRATFPAWFGDFDPNYPRHEDLYDDPDGPIVGGAEIARSMATTTGDDSWLALSGSLNNLINKAQIAYLEVYRDWLPRNAQMGTRWRPKKRLSQNHYDQPDGPHWGDMAGLGWDHAPPWKEIYEADHMKPVTATGKRQPKDGVIQAGLGDFPQRPIGTVPFRPVFHLANAWWHANRGPHFHPNFEACTFMPDHFAAHASSPHAKAWALQVAIDDLNPAARFWQLVCGQVDFLLQDDPELGEGERNRIFRVAGLVANREYRDATRPEK